ncbi:MAG: DUF1598 domain-containing protein [Planctomycetaceae bacterium]|nr:DUF1598 domain-containing protein [Planctomycetaceae bacterium]
MKRDFSWWVFPLLSLGVFSVVGGGWGEPLLHAQEPASTGVTAAETLARQLSAGEYSLALSSDANVQSKAPSAASQTRWSQILDHRRGAEQDFSLRSRIDRWGDTTGSSSQATPNASRISDADYSAGPDADAGGAPDSSRPGASGGMVQADFDSLIDLIQTVVEPDSWEENGGPGSISTFRNGVVIDVAGQLRFAQPKQVKSGSLLAGQASSLKLVKDAELRFVSLPKLESQLRAFAEAGQPVPDSVRYLGGMYEIQAIAVDAAAGDLFLVGPAGPWEINPQGVAVHVETQRPVLHLDDLVACLRNVMYGRSILGCSIDPKPGQFQKAAELAGKWNLTVPQVRDRFLTAVGPQDTAVFGVPAWSHSAHVLLTADYHIKLLAMGSIPAGPQLPSFLERCEADDPPSEIIRWWFTLADPEIQESEDSNLFTIRGPVMELKTEAKFVAGQRGGEQAAPPRSLAAESFVADFNRQLPQLRRLFPVYGQLENLFQWAVVAQVIHGRSLPARIGWQPSFLVGQREGNSRYAMQRFPEIREVELVVNHRTLPLKRVAGGPAQKQVIVAISGGVEVNATWDQVQSVMKSRSLDAFPSELRTGAEDVRSVLSPSRIGVDETTATLNSLVWFADH